ncbi:MAG TPA: hypothetical protein VH188_05265 [Chthoniobacterales bacterium]|jgi:hypothetical protein|nr:hypothetical protein [Chthoniobacterales bacterium]
MSVNIKTNVRTVIRYKGQEYSSADALPAEVRSAYEAAFAKGIAAIPGAKQQIVFNGQHFASAEEMPPAEKKLYEDAMGLVEGGAVDHESGPTPTNPSSGWLSPSQIRLVLLFGAIAALVVVLRLFVR